MRDGDGDPHGTRSQKLFSVACTIKRVAPGTVKLEAHAVKANGGRHCLRGQSGVAPMGRGDKEQGGPERGKCRRVGNTDKPIRI